MQCARCGEIFEGRFCPRCGTPASMTSLPSAAPESPVGWPCPRCGTLFAGNFCPRCGLPRGAWAPRPAPPSSARPILTILWTLAITGFVLFAVTDFAGLAVSLTSGRLLVSVDGSPVLDPSMAVAALPYSGPTGWTSTGRISVDPKITGPGQYYLKVAFIVDGATGAVDVGLDNVRLTWTTDAGVVLYVPAPLPLVVFVSQDKTVFLSYYALIAAAIFLIGGFYAVRERRETLRVLKAPIEA